MIEEIKGEEGEKENEDEKDMFSFHFLPSTNLPFHQIGFHIVLVIPIAYWPLMVPMPKQSSLGAHEKNGRFSPCEDFQCNASQHPPGDPRSTVGAHDDEVRSTLFCKVDDL